MRANLLLSAALTAGFAAHAAAQSGRHTDSTRSDDFRFTPALHAGQTLAVSNIDGQVTITQTSGASAEIVAHRIVRHGDGSIVKAVLEQTSSGYRVCTVYQYPDRDGQGCDGHWGRHSHNEPDLDVEMAYQIRLPAGVAVAVNTVDGPVVAHGLDTPAKIRTVDGNIAFDGVAPDELNTVDGSITATITNTDWHHDATARSVDGSIDLTLPTSLNATLEGSTVDGDIQSDFPVTITGKWGPQGFHGGIGSGTGPTLTVGTVDGGIHLRRAGGGDGHRAGNRR